MGPCKVVWAVVECDAETQSIMCVSPRQWRTNTYNNRCMYQNALKRIIGISLSLNIRYLR